MKKPPIQILLELLAFFPIRFQYRLAALMGFFVARCNNQIARTTDKNIRLCFANLNRAKQIELARASIRHTCASLIELAAVWCWPVDRVLARIDQTEITDRYLTTSKGRLIIAPHLGSWELLNIWLADKGDLFSLYKPQRNAKVDDFIFHARSRNGAQLVPTGVAGLRHLIRGLKQGATVMILPDQKPQTAAAGIDALFFDQPASTSGLIQSLCVKIDCEVFIGVVYRQPETATFKLQLEPLDHARLSTSPGESAQYLNDQIESRVRSSIDQYQWGYERFTRDAYESLQ